MSTIWGGASLLQMHLRAFKELSELKAANEWSWDFVLNLSESDFPIKYVLQILIIIKLLLEFLLGTSN